ncbi:GNAT family N-acetyltransferase [Cytobacillus luteolus]|nr:GNAT family N-acetyltransferase [Cytobacillus luteolus]MBP1944281.1 RimJ/RimL family protein N-acetyltransferase [Cytobacillus luteolus]
MKNINQFYYPKLESERYYLRLLTLDDAEDVYKHFADPQITKFMDIEPCKDIQEAIKIITYHIKDRGCRWGIYEKVSNQFVGTCGYHYIRDSKNQVIAEVGFDLAKAFWGKGIMTEVMHTVLDYGFKELGFDVIDATVELENQKSLVLMHKLGFTQSVELKDGLVYFYLVKDSVEDYEIRLINNLLEVNYLELVNESKSEGFRFLERLVFDYKSGSNTFSKPGEVLYGLFNRAGLLVAIGGLTIDPYAGDNKIGRLRRFYVARNERRKGLGRLLVDTILQEARTKFKIIVLYTDTEEASQFYRRIGFIKEGKYPNSSFYINL